jgi:predicted HTH domain antitoxin
MQFLRDSEDESRYVDILLRSMALIADYNSLIDELNESSDNEYPIYGLIERERCDALKDGDCMPQENEIDQIDSILSEKGIKIPDGLSVETMTKKELAKLAGLGVSDFDKLISNKRNQWNNYMTEEQLRKVANMVTDGSLKRKSKMYDGLTMRRAAEFLGVPLKEIEAQLR